MEEQIRDKFKCILIPNESVSTFKLEDKISKYLDLDYEYTSKSELDSYSDVYYFKDVPISIWLDEETNSIIETIACDKSCIWNEKELIGMLYNVFFNICQLKADKYEQLYSVGRGINGRNYDVYTFYELGLMIWVWRKKIRQVLVSRYEEDEPL